MANVVFQGPAALTLDGKGRIAIPSRHRELLAAMGVHQLTVTKHPEGSLLIFPRPAWENFRDRVAALPMDSSGWKRVFLGNAMDVDIDGSSRVLIAPELRKAAGPRPRRDADRHGQPLRALGMRSGMPRTKPR